MDKQALDDVPLWNALGLKRDFLASEVDAAFLSRNQGELETIAWNVLRDPYYSELYREYPSSALLKRAGFFRAVPDPKKYILESNNNSGLLFYSTPVGKIVNNLSRSEPEKESVVLLTTGGFSPIHDGHIQMMERAKEEMTRLGYNVVGGYLSPSHDQYVNFKCNGQAACHAGIRTAEVVKKIQDSTWLSIDPWESYYNTRATNFTEVLEHLEQYLTKVIGPANIKVAYVFGGDNAEFVWAFLKKGMAICVERYGAFPQFETCENEPAHENGRIFFVTNKTNEATLSSTEIRKSKAASNSEDPKGIYFVRNDFDLATKNMADRSDKNVFLSDLLKTFRKRISPNVAEIVLSSVEEQLDLTKAYLQNSKTVSLDLYYKGNCQLNLSRAFDLSDFQAKAGSVVVRPGAKLAENIEDVSPDDRICLVDDDISTGATTNFAKRLLLKYGISPSTLASIAQLTVGNAALYDVNDVRDFVIGSENGGLVVRLPCGDVARAPYVLPYVSPHFRAKISPENELNFSLDIWRLNFHLFRKYPDHRLANCDKYFRRLMKLVGFSDDCSLADICLWHLEELTKRSSVLW